MENILKFDELVNTICKETKAKGRMPIMENGYVFPLALERLMRGDSPDEVLQKLAVKKHEVSIATIKRFWKRYASVIDPVRKIGEQIRVGTMKPTEMLHIDYPQGNLNVRPMEEQDLKISEFEDPLITYAKMNAIQRMHNPLPRSVQEYGAKLETGEIVHLTGREFKQEKFDILSYRLSKGKQEQPSIEPPEIKGSTK